MDKDTETILIVFHIIEIAIGMLVLGHIVM